MTTHDPIPARLAALKTTPTSELKAQWRDLFDSEPPPFNRRYLESRLAYRIQELAYGDLKPETVKRLEALGEQLDARAALQQLDPLWDELFPAEQARIVALLVERVGIDTEGLNVRLRVDGLVGLAREMLTATADAAA
ncbi:DUF2924 domain-containing protein [Seohaeicola saemankumensis]|nr:DUF2924 domain-containing protein [Seohaeicola saemankumensis]MCA0871450.1 DUF2924 domain-containing protein [Seohaeicola saemankumensis]